MSDKFNAGNRVSEQFQDPLENYDPPEFKDPLEQALHDCQVAEIQTHPYVSISPDATIETALQQLAQSHVACLLVEEDGKLLGVFSDRDFLNKAALEYDDIKARPVREVMTSDPIYVFDTDSAAAALAVMAVSGYRHVPVVNLEHKLTGIVSPLRVLGFLKEHSSEA